ncbi:MAG: transposase [Chitinophagaceae bacterium]|nr:transposase [Rubrivivax sp.]
MDTIESLPAAGRRRRRLHRDEFKVDAVAAASQPGVSMASVALTRGVNANLLRRWVRESELPPAKLLAKSATVAPVFVAVQMPAPSRPLPISASTCGALPPPSQWPGPWPQSQSARAGCVSCCGAPRQVGVACRARSARQRCRSERGAGVAARRHAMLQRRLDAHSNTVNAWIARAAVPIRVEHEAAAPAQAAHPGLRLAAESGDQVAELAGSATAVCSSAAAIHMSPLQAARGPENLGSAALRRRRARALVPPQKDSGATFLVFSPRRHA